MKKSFTTEEIYADFMLYIQAKHQETSAAVITIGDFCRALFKAVNEKTKNYQDKPDVWGKSLRGIRAYVWDVEDNRFNEEPGLEVSHPYLKNQITSGLSARISFTLDLAYFLSDYELGEKESRDFPGIPDFFNDYVSKEDFNSMIANLEIPDRVKEILNDEYGLSPNDYEMVFRENEIDVPTEEEVIDKFHSDQEYLLGA